MWCSLMSSSEMFDKYQLNVDEVSRRRIAVYSQQRSVLTPRHKTKSDLVFGRRLCRSNFKHSDSEPIVATVQVAFRLCDRTML